MAFQTPKGRELYRAYINPYMGPVPCTFTFVYWFGDLWMFFSQIGVVQKLCRDIERYVENPTCIFLPKNMLVFYMICKMFLFLNFLMWTICSFSW